MGITAKDLTGQRFGRYIVLERTTKPPLKIMWRCRCDCGTEKSVEGYALTAKKVVSCGCFMREKSRTHGASKHPLFQVWKHMIERCYHDTDSAYKNYGGRGIYVCDRWRESPVNFISDMGDRPDRSYELDRINNNGPYSPDNCQWATCKTQANNRRSNNFLTFNGKTQSLIEWSREVGIKRSTIQMRLANYKWTVDEALTIPAHGRPR